MKPENPDESLLEQGLAAWDVPEPPPSLTDRILAQNAETLTALCTPPKPNPTQTEPPVLEEDRPAMLPTDLRTESSMRPLWTATALGFAAAAAIVLAFMAGRQSITLPAAAALTPIVPNVEVQITTRAPVAQPPVPPAPPAPPALPEKVIVSEPSEPVDAIAKPRRVRGVQRTPDLKNPFGSGESPPQTRKPADSERRSLKNPFAVGKATLRLGTNAGSAPAEVFVDGKPAGKTPITAFKVPPGKHTVVFRWASKTRSFTIEVEADEVRVVRADDK